MCLHLPEGKNSPPLLSWYMLQLMAPLRWWTRPQASNLPPNHYHHQHHNPPTQNTPPPEHASLWWHHHHTGWQPLLMARTRGLPCQCGPHAASACQFVSAQLFIHIHSNGAPEYSRKKTGPSYRNTFSNIILFILRCWFGNDIYNWSNWLMWGHLSSHLQYHLVLWRQICF